MTEPALQVAPIRFTSDVAAMQAFLQTLGFVVRLESMRGRGWVQLVHGSDPDASGIVSLHAVQNADTATDAGPTLLCLQCDDAEALRRSLVAAGYLDAEVRDESYGRDLHVTDPLGADVTLAERSDDDYGYHVYEPSADAAGTGGWRVVPVRFTDDFASYATFLRAVGFVGEVTEHYSGFRLPGDRGGEIGLHRVGEDLPIDPSGSQVHLTFATTDPLEPIAEALTAAGHADVAITQEAFGSFLDVTDPDGKNVQVHQRPA